VSVYRDAPSPVDCVKEMSQYEAVPLLRVMVPVMVRPAAVE